MVRAAAGFALLAIVAVQLQAVEPERDYSGKWTLDLAASRVQALGAQPDETLTVVQQDVAMQVTGSAGRWSYLLDGSETRYKVGGETRNSVVKWEGAALLINTIVSEPQNYTIMERWTMNRDRTALTIRRQIVRRGGETEGLVVYRAQGRSVPAEPRPVTETSAAPAPPAPTLTRQPPPPAAGEIVLRAGTHIPLSLRNNVDTKHARDGDHIYLETYEPVYVDGVLVVPRGSYVNGTVTQSKQPGKGKSKGELFIRFDSLILPNGVTREFRSRLGNADIAKGQVDRQEGKVTGERDSGKDAETVAGTTVAGAGIGGIAGRSLKGVGIGGAAGAAAGLATIFMKRGADASLPRGTMVEMILDRDLTFTREELARRAQ